MIKAELIRIEKTFTETCGILLVQGRKVCDTLELPWKDNFRRISCIPEGDYKVELYNSPTFGLCYKILDVPNRNYILFHTGNTVADIKGCVLVGRYVGWWDGHRHLFSSRKGMKDLKLALKGIQEFYLQIRSL
jgi:hypothetical protein